MQEKYGFVYIWYDRKHKRFYIGSHWGTEDDGYICSSVWMKNAYRRRPQDFKRRILSKIYSDRKSLYENEETWLAMIKPEEIKIRYYNLCIGKTTHWTATDNHLSIRAKISKAQIGRKLSEETLSKMRGRKLSPEHIQKLKGRRLSPASEFKPGHLPKNAGITNIECYGIEKAAEIQDKISGTQFKPGVVSHNAKAIQTPFGEFQSIDSARKILNIGRKIIEKNIRNNDDWYLVTIQEK